MHETEVKSSPPSTENSEEEGPSWYRRCLNYVRNHGRVDPAKVEFPHCDFFIVGQRRTLRILKPTLRGRWFYDSNNDRPESLNDNFFTRWSKRPHPSGNCRCSFRQSARLSSTEEQIISAEINRIRNSLCEAEKNGQDLEEIERTVAINLENLIPVTNEPKKSSLVNDEGKVPEEKIIKNKIIQDLERYINDLLQEIVTDSVKFVADAEKLTGRKEDDFDEKNEDDVDAKVYRNGCITANLKDSVDAFVNINFAFLGNENDNESDRKSDLQRSESGKSVDSDVAKRNLQDASTGYENPGYLGSCSDPDALEFYLNRPVSKNSARCPLQDQLDCVDSGINSVETVEFQPDQEPSLEESLMEIIDAKLGRTHIRKSWEDFKGSPNEITEEVSPDRKEQQISDRDNEVTLEKDTDSDERNTPKDLAPLDEVGVEPQFQKLRLEFTGKSSTLEDVQLRKKSLPSLRRKNRSCDPFGRPHEDLLDLDERKESDSSPEYLGQCESKTTEDSGSSAYAEDPRELVLFRKNRKPTIVFLHGYGSSADVFERQLEYFSNLGYPCIAPDMLGHGLSSAPDRPRDYHFNKLFKDLEVLLHHYAFRPGQKCVLVAHNYGCSLAAAMACKYDSNIHQLVLISGGGPTPLARPSAEGAAHCCLRALVAPLLVCGLRREVMYSPRGRQHPYCGTESPEQRPSHMKYVLDGMEWPDGEYTFYRRVCTPTLLVHGLRDNEVSLVQECQMERTMVKAFLEALPSAGHIPMMDCPDQLNHMIHCFIDLWKNKKW
ncbi:uncharacterized protein LOC105688715 isoform X2 [Athalia rosae]|uniref:uncharacterized protein LOC105688715 isoform X2 n=1 Tax=Athalia rosae TaxID=37344 RepID=UPI0020332490|nr:uncharacterized protein LOC105688715 isoform X2 [Athalia rosae]